MRDAQFEETDEPAPARGGAFFLRRYQAICPDAALLGPDALKQALRTNTVKTTNERLVRDLNRRGALLTRIPFLRNGFFAQAQFSLGASVEYLLGYYYLQGPLSQLACEVLDPAPDASILDMASAPGGKATHLAMLAPRGRIVALDYNPDRLAAVRNNAERLGCANIVCVRKDARFAKELGVQFDAVLLDAPCSGNMCSEQGWLEKRMLSDIVANARVQRELLKAAYACVRPGGKLLYSTCSLEPEEDELIISWALGKFPDLDVAALDHLPLGDPGSTEWSGERLDPRVAGTRRFWPHKTGCEGFYIALLVKR
jgi:NOL1/NOP2/sun family putative RNA methylase